MRAIAISVRSFSPLPAIMREGLVGLRHPMRVFALLHRRAAIVRGVEKLCPKAARSWSFSERPRAVEISQRIASAWRAVRAHFDGHLVGGAADAARAHLEMRASRSRARRGSTRIASSPVLRLIVLEGAIDDVLGDRFLAVMHQRVHELGERRYRRISGPAGFRASRRRGDGTWTDAPLLRPLGAVLGPALPAVLARPAYRACRG